MAIASNNVCYVRVFDLPPEVLITSWNSAFWSTGKWIVWFGKNPTKLRSGPHTYTTALIDVKKESNWKGKVFYQDFLNKCFVCRADWKIIGRMRVHKRKLKKGIQYARRTTENILQCCNWILSSIGTKNNGEQRSWSSRWCGLNWTPIQLN